jgi:hypothetical protein
VRRAATELRLGAADTVAIDCPSFVLEDLESRIAQFPDASVLTISTSEGDQEVFPVVPCDGIVEAIRVARKHESELVCVDADFSAALFWNRHCFREQDWPDDEFAVQMGGAAYFDLVDSRARSPWRRVEPVDSWRESYMAEALRRKHLECDRIFFVCEIGRVRGVMERLRRSAPAVLHGETASQPECEYMNPSTWLLLQYLDDYPAVVRRFEETRSLQNPKLFSKQQVAIEIIGQAYEQEWNCGPSVREFAAFCTLAQNLAIARNRISPDLEITLTCVSACFDECTADAVRKKLLAYGNQIRTDAVGGLLSAQEDYFESMSGERTFAARSCNPMRQSYDVMPQPSSLLFQSPWGRWVWPPYSGLMRETVKRITRLAMDGPAWKQHRELICVPFDGTLGNGIDCRRTLRAVLNAPAKLYIRKPRNSTVSIRIDRLEPVVVILRTELTGRLMTTNVGIKEEFIEAWSYGREQPPAYNNTATSEKIYIFEVGGFVNFLGPAAGTTFIRKEFGHDVSWRVPRRDEMDKLDAGLFPGRCARYHSAAFAWWVTLVLGAAEYAKSDVIAVLPDDCDLPTAAKYVLSARKKNLCRISLSSIDAQTRSRLEKEVSVVGRLEFKQEDEVWSGLVKHFEDRVNKFWT